MKKVKTGILLFSVISSLFLALGCSVHGEADFDDDDCCPKPRPVTENWRTIGESLDDLEVGLECPGGDDYSDVDYNWETIELDYRDNDLVDARLAVALTNSGDEDTRAWVSLCDNHGCSDAVDLLLHSGEVFSLKVDNPVLDEMLSQFDSCLDRYGTRCDFEYDLQVNLGQENTCSPVTLEYHFEGKSIIN